MLALLAGCRGERDALRDYLAADLPSLTEGSQAVVEAFRRAATPRELDERVVLPYRAILERLRAYEPSSDTVRRLHAAYVAAAERQLAAFETARSALASGRSLDEAAGMLKLVRSDLDRWLTEVTANAERLGVALLGP